MVRLQELSSQLTEAKKFKNILCYGSAYSETTGEILRNKFKNILCYGSAVKISPISPFLELI